jgi:signal transduction histidine kinase/CheY-like chemotaxis protein
MKKKNNSLHDPMKKSMIRRWLPHLRYRVLVAGIASYCLLCFVFNRFIHRAFQDVLSLSISTQKETLLDTLTNTLFHVELALGILLLPVIYLIIRNIEHKLDALTQLLHLFDYSGFKEIRRVPPETLPWVLIDLETTLNNVLERVKKEVSHLQHEESSLKDMVDHLPGAIVNLDEEGHCLFLSSVWHPLIRQSTPKQCIGQPFKSFIHAQHINDFQKNSDALLSGAQTHAVCHVSLKQTIPPRPVELQMVRYINTTGLVSILMYIFDCSTSAHNEDLLRHENQRLYQWLDALPLPFYAKNSSGQYLFFNPAWEKLTQIPRLQWIGKTAWDVFEPAIAQTFWEHERALLDHKTSTLEETDVRDAHGHTQRALVYRAPILENDIPVGTLGLIASLDQYSQHTRLQNRMDKAEQQDRQHTQMLAHLSSRTRSQLHNLLGLVDLMHSWLKSLALPHNNEYLGLIHSIADTMLTTTTDINDILSFEQQTTLVNCESFNLENILIESARHFSPQAEAKHLELVVHIDQSLPEYIKGDAQLLKRAVNLLLHNAIKFTPSGLIELSATLLQMELDEVLIRFKIRDTGIGIQEDQQPHVFEPFMQSDVALARQQQGGSGLGLTVFSRLMQRVGARYSLISHPGQGSTFSFEWSFPYIPKIPIETFEHTRPSTILIVESHTRTTQVLSEIASTQFSHVLSAQTVQQAISLLKESPLSGSFIDAILIDGRLSDEDRSAPFRILEMALNRGVPHRFVMLPVHAPFREHERYRQAQATTLLLKPLNKNEFITALTPATPPALVHELLPNPSPSLPLTSLEAPKPNALPTYVLIATHDPINKKLIEGWILQQGHRCITVRTNEELMSYYTAERFSAVIIDLDMGRSGGIELLRLINLQNKILNYKTPVIVMFSGKYEEYSIPTDTPIWGQIEKPVQQSVLITMLGTLQHAASPIKLPGATSIVTEQSIQSSNFLDRSSVTT